MSDRSVLILKFNRGSVADKMLSTVQRVLGVTDRAEAFRRALSIAEAVALAQKEGSQIVFRRADGTETLCRSL
jgi:hypothetical protein